MGHNILKDELQHSPMSESLSDVYEENLGEFESLRHLYIGTALFIIGVLAVATGIVVSTTEILAGYGLNTWQHWEVAGVIAGLGLPTAFMGIFSVLPSNTRRTRLAALGTTICVIGVVMFFHFFPHQWHGDTPDYTLQIVSTYALGAGIAFWCTFGSIVDFKTRNDPGGTVTLEVTRQGETHYVEVDKSELDSGAGGVGFFGETPDGNVETQTNNPEQTSTAQHGDNVPADADRDWPEFDR